MYVRGIRKKLCLAGIAIALLSGVSGTAEAEEAVVTGVQETETVAEVLDTEGTADAQEASYIADIQDTAGTVDAQETSYIADIQDTAGTADAQANDGHWAKEDGVYYYYLNGEKVKDTVMEIEGELYGFDQDGAMYDDEDFYFYSGRKFVCCRAKAGGALYRDGWYTDNSRTPEEYYYYREDGTAALGYTEIDGVYYIFSDFGRLYVNELGKIDGLYYTADSEGHATKITKKNGWVSAGEYSWYYLENGKVVEYDFREIKGKLYYFGSSGKLFMGGEFDLSRSGSRCYYRAKKDGSLYVNEWAEVEGVRYYYGADGAGAKGLTKVDDKTYYFWETGELLTSSRLSSPIFTDSSTGITWIVNSEGVAKKVPKNGWLKMGSQYLYFANGQQLKGTIRKIDGLYYAFNSEGIMYADCRFYQNGNYYRADKQGALLQNTWFKDEYYGEDAIGLMEFAKVNGKQYYFNQGKAVYSCYVADDGDKPKLYYADKSGILSPVTQDGLYYAIDGSTYYAYFLQGGKLLAGTWKKVGNEYYYFSDGSYGYRYENYVDGKTYIFRTDGILMRGGWIHTNLYTYYAKNSGELLTGKQKIDGKWYLFNGLGELQTGIVLVDGNYWLCGNDGALIGKSAGEGWNVIEGERYYIKDGELLSGVQTIDKKEYFFHSSGRMLKNYIDEENGHIYGAKGARVKSGWVKVSGSWYYVDPSTGQYVKDDLLTIKGKDYYFGYFGALQIGTVYIDSYSSYITDADGAILKRVGLKVGWNLVDGYDRYVAPNGDTSFTGWVGNYYVSDGYLMKEIIVDGKYLIDAEGRWVKKQGWYRVISKAMWYIYHEVSDRRKQEGKTSNSMDQYVYVKADGQIAKGWLQIGKDWYYFSSDGSMVTGIRTIGKNVYMFDENGKYLKTLKDPKEGWYKYQNTYVYIAGNLEKNGEVVEYGKRYLLEDGMVANAVVWEKNYFGSVKSIDGYYYGKDGAADLSKRGWKKINGKWFYFRKDGKAAGGWLALGGKNYYIDYDNGMVTGVRVINRQIYTFDANGALTGQVVKTNGWYEGADGWYYFQDGKLTEESSLCINGVVYAFSDGKMAANQFAGTSYMDKNGHRVKKQWKKINGKWFYFDENGDYVTGKQTIGGKTYIFNMVGEMME
ncbi:MAG: hypothetical protein IJM25_03695 [Eubacterium sp.]|nr:hypothetical protein [Eubacterium sp.]